MKTATSSRKTQQASEWSNFVTKTPSLSLCLASKVPPPLRGNKKASAGGRWRDDTHVSSASLSSWTQLVNGLSRNLSHYFFSPSIRDQGSVLSLWCFPFFNCGSWIYVCYDGCRFSETPPLVMTSRNLTVLITGVFKSRDKECWSVQLCWFWKSKPCSNWTLAEWLRQTEQGWISCMWKTPQTGSLSGDAHPTQIQFFVFKMLQILIKFPLS